MNLYKLINKVSSIQLIIIFLGVYFIFVILFSGIYYGFYKVNNVQVTNDVNTPISSFSGYIYFSFVTQSALGHGDYRPKGEIGWILVIIQTSLGMLIFAIGTGTVVATYFIPKEKGVWFHNKLMHNYKDKCFQFCIASDFPIELYDVRARIGINFKDKNRGIRNKKIELISGRQDFIGEKGEPFIFSTKSYDEQKPVELSSLEKEDAVYLEPQHIIDTAEFIVTLAAKHDYGSIRTQKKYDLKESIRCGSFPDSYFHGAMIVNGRLKMGQFGSSEIGHINLPSECHSVPFLSTCLSSDSYFL